jgi:hypothetical protein
MKRYSVLLALLLLSVSTARLDAQLNFSLSAGGSFPVSSLDDGAGTGWIGQASVGVSSLIEPLGFRLDAGYSRWPGEGTTPAQAVRMFTLNLKYGLSQAESSFSPYLIGGGGAYRFGCVDDVSTCPAATTRFGWNGGLGARLSGIGTGVFAEARYNYVDTGSGIARFVPVTVGITFGY